MSGLVVVAVETKTPQELATVALVVAVVAAQMEQNLKLVMVALVE
tara:strand:+ start:1025 stop:1159 length:135 start_codon:yes stop_codon:yes gene_type:complete